MRTAVYLRCSTTDQDLEAQRAEVLDAARIRGLEIVEVYEDQGESGARRDRPALGRLLRDAAHRRFGAVLIQRLDRLGRSVKHLCEIAGELEARGVDLIAARQAIDTTGPTGRLVFHVLASVSEFERELIRERVRTGLARAKVAPRPGKRRPGRPRVVRLDVERARELLATGQTLSETARALGVSRGALRHRLNAAG